MAVSRRDALKSLVVTPFFRLKAEDSILIAIAEVVLPSEADRKAAVDAFTRWIENYQEGADTDHGYGNPRVRTTGPSPARNYPVQIAALEAAARARGSAAFSAASLQQRRAILEAAITEAKIERLPARPSGGHIAADLMGHYFNSSAANDLCYRAAIGRDDCRGLAGSESAPLHLAAARTPRGAAPAASHPDAPRASHPAPRT